MTTKLIKLGNVMQGFRLVHSFGWMNVVLLQHVVFKWESLGPFAGEGKTEFELTIGLCVFSNIKALFVKFKCRKWLVYVYSWWINLEEKLNLPWILHIMYTRYILYSTRAMTSLSNNPKLFHMHYGCNQVVVLQSPMGQIYNPLKADITF